ncbi:MAG: hypothetical protein E7055_04540 [Lentisphaerae bacterium]|nr:hypothetical protein [Lentisphaerota bacterium]
MEGYTFQTHSVYRNKSTGGLLLLVHHNPMVLCSLLLPGKADSFDTATPRQVGVDTIIGMRQSGSFEELPPIPEDRFAALLRDLAGHVTPDDLPFVQALIDQLEKK